jgi:hypothetical protein
VPKHDATWREPVHSKKRYSPNLVEAVFCEIQMPYGPESYSPTRIFMHHHNM